MIKIIVIPSLIMTLIIITNGAFVDEQNHNIMWHTLNTHDNSEHHDAWANFKYYQIVFNATQRPITVVLTYHSFLCGKKDEFFLMPNAIGRGNPGACLLKKIEIKDANNKIVAEKNFDIFQHGNAQGSWHIIENKDKSIEIKKEY